MNALQLQDHIIKRPIEEGDCGIILRKNGGFDIFSASITAETILTDAQEENGILLTAIAICLKSPEMKNMLIQLATDPAIVGDDPFNLSHKH